jgi:hypothetical protein
VIEVLFLAAFAVLAVLQHRANQAALEAERERVTHLLLLLEAKAAPKEVLALGLHDEGTDDIEWLYSDDGLVAFPAPRTD